MTLLILTVSIIIHGGYFIIEKAYGAVDVSHASRGPGAEDASPNRTARGVEKTACAATRSHSCGSTDEMAQRKARCCSATARPAHFEQRQCANR